MAQANGLVKGRVKWFSVEKGYGFIVQDEGEGDVYVNASEVPERVVLAEDTLVEFTLEEGKRGLRARNVKLLQGKP
jgi:cold shock protein